MWRQVDIFYITIVIILNVLSYIYYGLDLVLSTNDHVVLSGPLRLPHKGRDPWPPPGSRWPPDPDLKTSTFFFLILWWQLESRE